MVAYVYKTTRTLGDYPREILKLSGSPTARECEVSEFYTNGSNYRTTRLLTSAPRHPHSATFDQPTPATWWHRQNLTGLRQGSR